MISLLSNISKLYKIDSNKQIPEILQQGYLPSLDGFRAISIVLVVVAHASGSFSGHLGVSVFFVISGFLISTLLQKEYAKTGTVALKNFYIRRSLRILPVSFLYLFVLLLLKLFSVISISTDTFASCLLFLRNTSLLNPSNIDSFTGHYWSLSVEEQFYLIFPFLLFATIRKPIRFLMILFSVFLLVHVSNYVVANKEDLSRLFVVIGEFLRNLSGITIGAFFSILFFNRVVTENILGRYRVLWSVLLAICVVFIHTKILPFIPSSLSEIFIAVLIIGNLKPSSDFIFRFLNFKPIVFVGILSYSIYIWQQLFTVTIPWGEAFPYADSVFFNIPILLIVSYMSYNYFEKYFLKFKTRYN